MKKCVESAPITSMQKEWFDNILSMIPAELKKQKGFNDYCKDLFAEVEANFQKSMKKSMGMFDIYCGLKSNVYIVLGKPAVGRGIA